MGNTAVILHHSLSSDALPDEVDVLVQASAVSDALKSLGYETHTVSLGLDIKALAARLGRLKPVIVFNLVESLDNDGRLIHLACSILDHLGIPYTGAGTEAMFLTSNKVLAKAWMKGAGIPTPEWVVPGSVSESDLPFPDTYIIKTLWEEASIGIDKESVRDVANLPELMTALGERSRILRKPCFAERFIDGREFNLSVLGSRHGAQVLPPAEITFSFPDDRRKMVDYKAKWDEDSVEYKCTQRSFVFEAGDAGLLEELSAVAARCWKAFELRGYARVDFRVDGQGRPWVLEINANPCISPDSGFVAASEKAGLSYPEVIAGIISDTLDGNPS
jgi:D-alanine-D-alanine ligase